MLYAFLRERDPGRLIKVGSGHSTLFAARAVQDGGPPSFSTCFRHCPPG